MKIRVSGPKRVFLGALAVAIVLLVALQGCGPVMPPTDPTTTTIPPALTPRGTPTTTTSPRPSWIPTQWQSRLQDSLNSSECDAWQCGPDDNGTNRLFSSEGYELIAPPKQSIQGKDSRPADVFSDFYYQATLIIKSAANDDGIVGLVFRLDNNDSDYLFDSDASGDWQLSYQTERKTPPFRAGDVSESLFTWYTERIP
jgi:hypothetical protein